jgi:protein SCO1/2
LQPFRELVAVLILALMTAACSAGPGPRARQYQLRGQVLALVPDRREVTVKHEDIPGFMPAMTMAYKVRDAKLLDGLSRGDLITATLNVREAEAWLSNIQRNGHADVAETGPLPRVMDLLEPGDAVPGTLLQDQNGQPRHLTDWRGRAVAVTFVYSRCPMPDFCPLLERQFAEVQRRVQSDAGLAESVHLIAISFDPEHDTPPVLEAHARLRGADPHIWTYLTGTPRSIEDIASRFGVSVMREDGDAGTLTHNLRTAVIDPQGRLVKIYSGSDWTAATLIEDLREARGRR